MSIFKSNAAIKKIWAKGAKTDKWARRKTLARTQTDEQKMLRVSTAGNEDSTHLGKHSSVQRDGRKPGQRLPQAEPAQTWVNETSCASSTAEADELLPISDHLLVNKPALRGGSAPQSPSRISGWPRPARFGPSRESH